DDVEARRLDDGHSAAVRRERREQQRVPAIIRPDEHACRALNRSVLADIVGIDATDETPRRRDAELVDEVAALAVEVRDFDVRDIGLGTDGETEPALLALVDVAAGREQRVQTEEVASAEH